MAIYVRGQINSRRRQAVVLKCYIWNIVLDKRHIQTSVQSTLTAISKGKVQFLFYNFKNMAEVQTMYSPWVGVQQLNGIVCDGHRVTVSVCEVHFEVVA